MSLLSLSRLVPTATVLLLASAAPARGADADPWLGADKALHFGASVLLASDGYALGAALWDDPRARLGTGAGLSVSLGVAKELWDLSGHGDPSWKDLTWDIVGTATGLLVAWTVDRLTEPRRRPASNTSASPPPLGARRSRWSSPNWTRMNAWPWPR